MNLLLVEDNEHKSARIQEFLHSAVPRVDIVCAQSVQEGLKRIRERIPDIVLLDMSLPAFNNTIHDSGFKHTSYAGKDVLEYLDSFEIEVPVIIITAFTTFGADKNAFSLEELNAKFTADFPDHYVGTVWYSSLEHNWKEKLLELIHVATKKSHD
ncbi:response regulator [Hymenobacter psychrophilus]|uniref:response regulator n=1 Tax=Hymenobacter psychrophilus TaxID=651662 RepID=UPI000B88942D|nr:response regulator [Hymenobacter psychrophilus]